jgi:hypothetical protein
VRRARALRWGSTAACDIRTEFPIFPIDEVSR